MYIIMTEENMSQEFRLKNIKETRNNFVEEINLNVLMSKKHKETLRRFELYWTLTHFAVSTVTGGVTGGVFNSVFDSLVDFL